MENPEKELSEHNEPKKEDVTPEKGESGGGILAKVILFIIVAIPVGYIGLFLLSALMVMNM